MKPTMTDDAFYEIMSSTDKNFGKRLDGNLTINARQYTQDQYLLHKLYDSSLYCTINPPPEQRTEADNAKKTIETPVKFIADFSSDKPLIPHSVLKNSLYLYPQVINIINPPKVAKLKHIIIRAFYLISDEKLEDETTLEKRSQYFFFGKSHSKNFVRSQQLNLIYNNKRPDFFDEIKVRLPMDFLLERHHVVFAVYNMAGKLRKEETEMTFIGFGFLPFAMDGKPLEDKQHVINIWRTLDNAYLKGNNAEDASKAIATIHVTSKLASSVFPFDAHIYKFFNARSISSESCDNKIIEGIAKSSLREKVKFFPMILHHLLDVLRNDKSANTQQYAFRTLILVAKHILSDGKDERSSEFHPVLVSYLNHHFNPATSEGAASLEIHNKILDAWTILVNESGLSPEGKNLMDITMNDLPWFFFGLIFRSMALKALQENALNASGCRLERFPEATHQKLSTIVRSFVSIAVGSTTTISTAFNTHFALFITDLFRIADRGFVFSLVREYVHGLSGDQKRIADPEMAVFRIQFLQILTGYEHYVPLCLPGGDKIDSVDTMDLSWWRRHYLSGYLINEIEQAVQAKEIETSKAKPKQTAAGVLRDLMWKHELDSRYSAVYHRQLIANMYFPQFQRIVKNFRNLRNKIPAEEMRDWCACVIFVMRYCDPELFQQWWSMEDFQWVVDFFEMLLMGVDLLKETPGQKPTQSDVLMFTETCYVTVHIIELFIADFQQEILDCDGHPLQHKVYNHICTLLPLLLRFSSSDTVTQVLCHTIRQFVFLFSPVIFRKSKSMFPADICAELLVKALATGSRTIADACTSVVYVFLKCNYDEMGEILMMKMSLTVAVSKLSNETYIYIPRVLDALLSAARTASPPTTTAPKTDSFLFHVTDITGRLYRIVHYVLLLPNITDMEQKYEVYRKLAMESSHSIELRVKCLMQLCNFHERSGNHEEAGQCRVITAALIISYLKIKATETGDELSVSHLPALKDFSLVAPNVVSEPLMHAECLFESTSALFHEKSCISLLESAIDNMLKASVFEQGVELLAIIFHLHKSANGFEKLIGVAQLLNDLASRATKAIESNTRIFSHFYRVTFYGKKFGLLNEAKYIYRDASRITDFTNRLMKQFSDDFGEEVRVLPNKPRDELDMDPNANYLQIISTFSHIDPQRLKAKKEWTTYDKQHGVDKFGFDAPWSPDGKPSDEVSKQHKIRTIYVTERIFPDVLRRLKVTEEKKETLGPLDCAIDLIDSRIEAIKVELQLRPPNTKTLQIVLSGSIMTTVNAGPKAIMQYFFGPSASNEHDQGKILILRQKLAEFVRKCDFALRLNKNLIADDQKEYQKAMEEHFNVLKSEAVALNLLEV